jgi:hypothetical protein
MSYSLVDMSYAQSFDDGDVQSLGQSMASTRRDIDMSEPASPQALTRDASYSTMHPFRLGLREEDSNYLPMLSLSDYEYQRSSSGLGNWLPDLQESSSGVTDWSREVRRVVNEIDEMKVGVPHHDAAFLSALKRIQVISERRYAFKAQLGAAGVCRLLCELAKDSRYLKDQAISLELVRCINVLCINETSNKHAFAGVSL